MSTEIKTIKGSCHIYDAEQFKVLHKEADLYLTRFFNGIEKGACIQLTISNPELGTSYIHLTEEQCKELATTLNECFDENKYPSE